MSLYASGSQTVGPYLHIGLTWLNTSKIAGPGVKGPMCQPLSWQPSSWTRTVSPPAVAGRGLLGSSRY